MHKLRSSQIKATEASTLILPKATPLRVKMPNTDRLPTTPRSLNNSRLSLSLEASHPYIKLPNSFYNDRKNIYHNRSKALSEKSLSFQSRHLTLSERRRYQSVRTEQVVGKRDKLRMIQQSCDTGVKVSKSAASMRFRDIASNKYKKLLYGQQMVRVNRALLQKDIKRSFSQKVIKKWTSPFVGQSHTQKLRGKPLVSKQMQPLLPPGNPTQLKVLNLDRLFRVREGKLTNVVPLPVAKLSQVNSRDSIFKAVKHQDKIHEAIKQYNILLRTSKIGRSIPKLGVKGKQFTKSPTIQELMGLKLAPSRKQSKTGDSPLLQPQIFTQHSLHFQKCIKQDIHLTRRVLSGIIRNQIGGYISLSAYTLFWQLFISRTASFDEKVNFLQYFFLPAGQEKVELQVIKLILEIMCRQLPPIQKLDLKTQVLSTEQKSKIFLQALIRVLFGETMIQESRGITRIAIKQIFYANPDACDLLIRLLQVDQ